jgi:hypothetical protein
VNAVRSTNGSRQAPQSAPLCGKVAALVSIDDLADRPAHALADGETLALGKHSVRWFDTPHLPHAWECGFLMEDQTRTLLCGDLFTSPAPNIQPPPRRISSGRAKPSVMRWTTTHTRRTGGAMLERLAAAGPTTLCRACTEAPGRAMEQTFCARLPMH